MSTITRRAAVATALAAAFAVLAGGPPARAGKSPVYTDRNGVAIDGTDPVAYFTEGRPVQGSPDFEHRWNGAVWRFSSAANRDAFAANPARYAPQYGGWCAWAVAEGYTASTVPDAWQIVDGRLYLNFSRRVHRTWARDARGNIARANRNWPAVLD